MTDKRITLKDVARAAGVATGTVSMVLNDSPLDAATTRAHVQKVMQDVGYVYDRAAGLLRNRRSRIVGVSMCDIGNPYYADVTAGIQAALEILGRVLVLGNCSVVPRQNASWGAARVQRGGLAADAGRGNPKTSWSGCSNGACRWCRSRPRPISSATTASRAWPPAPAGPGHATHGYIGLNRKIHRQGPLRRVRRAMKGAGEKLAPDRVIDARRPARTASRASFALRKGVPPTGVVCFNVLLAFGRCSACAAWAWSLAGNVGGGPAAF